MTCHYLPTLSSYHDGELSPGQAADLEAHLSSCASCRGELRALRRISAVMDHAPRLELSKSARGRILAGLRAGERNRQIMTLARPFAAAASVIVALGLPLLLAAPASTSTTSTASLASAPVWEATLLSHDSESVARSTSQDQVAEWVAADLASNRR
jgi:anti-sigma factor RsiW